MTEGNSLRFLNEADVWFRLADTAQLKGKFHEALRDFRRALTSYRRAKNRSGTVNSWLKIADVCRQIEDFKAAHSAYVSAWKLAKQGTELDQQRRDAMLGEALCLRGQGEFNAALKKLHGCLTGYRVRRDVEAQAYVLWALGTTERFAGKFTEAERHLRKSILLYRQLGDESGLAYAFCGLGGTLRMQGRAKLSFSLYRRANGIFKKLKDRFGTAYSYCGQSNALRMQNNLVEALPLMKQAEKIYRSLRMRGPLAFVLWSQAQLFISRGQSQAANGRLDEARQLFQTVRDNRGLLYVMLGQGQRLLHKNNLKYQSVFKNAFKFAKKLELPFEMAHALRVSDPTSAKRIYSQCGTKSSSQLFRNLP